MQSEHSRATGCGKIYFTLNSTSTKLAQVENFKEKHEKLNNKSHWNLRNKNETKTTKIIISFQIEKILLK